MAANKASQHTWEALHEILGVALGASIDHITESERPVLISSVTDAAFRTLIDPEERGKYKALLLTRPPLARSA